MVSRSQVMPHGFTLIEILVAVAIFAIIAVASNSILTNVIDADAASQRQIAQLESIQRTMLIIERDITQMVARPTRIQGQDNKIVFTGGENILESASDGIAFMRNGWTNPQWRLPRANLQGVAYRLNDNNQIERVHTLFPDNVTGSEPKIRVLLDNIVDLQFEYAVPNQNGNDLEWSDTYQGVTLPSGLAVTLESERFGIIRREFAVLPGIATDTTGAFTRP